MACPCRLHDICIDKFFRIHKATSCPRCQTDWTDNNRNFVGERVVTNMVGQGKKRSGVQKSRAVAVEASEEGEEAGEEGEE